MLSAGFAQATSSTLNLKASNNCQNICRFLTHHLPSEPCALSRHEGVMDETTVQRYISLHFSK